MLGYININHAEVEWIVGFEYRTVRIIHDEY